jgi:hypothetical protein
MTPAAAARETTVYKEACRLMKIPADGRPISVRLGVGEKTDGSQVSLGTRSLYASFFFLANGVEPPADDLQAGVLQRRRLNGGAFDGGGELFRIRTSSQRPQDATVKVRYRDQWFYIAATDPDTRTTFALLSMMLTLQSGDSTRLTPLISVSSGP